MNTTRTTLTLGIFALLVGCSSTSSQQEAQEAPQPQAQAPQQEIADAPAPEPTSPPEPAVPAEEPVEEEDDGEAEAESNAGATAELQMLKPKSKDAAQAGQLRFVPEGDALRIEGDFTGLPPGARGLKILDTDSCDKVTKKTPDYNPTGAKHGSPASSERHVGDLGNIVVTPKGEAEFEMVTDSMTIGKDTPSSVLDKVVVITRRKDNGKSQPAGNAGPAIACGKIENQ